MSPTANTHWDTEQRALCPLCSRRVDPSDRRSVTITVGRSEVLECEDERLFRESQEFEFCDLAHANDYLASHAIPDKWENTEIDDGKLGLLEKIGCLLLVIAFLAVIGTGVTVLLDEFIGLFK